VAAPIIEALAVAARVQSRFAQAAGVGHAVSLLHTTKEYLYRDVMPR
jgi:hypothetical protein